MESNAMVNEFFELVQLDAASLNERAVADAILNKLKEFDCRVFEDDAGTILGGNTGNIYAIFDGELEGSVLFGAHMDRVANGIGIKPQIKDGRIVSDGTTILAADDIAGVVALLDGIRRIKASGIPTPRLEFVFVVCEEKIVLGSKYLHYNELKSKFGYFFDSPGRIGDLVYTAPSKARMTIEVFGKTAHAGNAPEKGVNAIVAGAKILADIKDGRIDEETTANFASFDAVSPVTNLVCDHAVIKGEVRSRNVETFNTFLEYVKDHCQEKIKGTGATVNVNITKDYYGFNVPFDGYCIPLISKAFDEMGIAVNCKGAGGGGDACRLNENGIECVLVSTGCFDNHGPKESLIISDFIRLGEVIEKIVSIYAQQNER